MTKQFFHADIVGSFLRPADLSRRMLILRRASWMQPV